MDILLSVLIFLLFYGGDVCVNLKLFVNIVFDFNFCCVFVVFCVGLSVFVGCVMYV